MTNQSAEPSGSGDMRRSRNDIPPASEAAVQWQPEPSAIAAGLTKAQRAMMLRAEEDGHLGNPFIRWWHGSGRTIRSLRRRDLGSTVWSGLVLTPLGIAVRDHLLSEQGHD